MIGWHYGHFRQSVPAESLENANVTTSRKFQHYGWTVNFSQLAFSSQRQLPVLGFWGAGRQKGDSLTPSLARLRDTRLNCGYLLLISQHCSTIHLADGLVMDQNGCCSFVCLVADLALLFNGTYNFFCAWQNKTFIQLTEAIWVKRFAQVSSSTTYSEPPNHTPALIYPESYPLQNS